MLFFYAIGTLEMLLITKKYWHIFLNPYHTQGNNLISMKMDKPNLESDQAHYNRQDS